MTTTFSHFPPTFAPVISTYGRWLQVVTNTDPRYGGLSSTVPALGCKISSANRIDTPLAAFCAPDELYRPAGYSSDEVTFWPSSRGTWLKNRAARQSFDAEVGRADGLHIHGLWEQSTALACRSARSLGKPYILSAHGMLEPWALANKRLKKLVYSTLIERNNVKQATCLHALTRVEADQYKRFGGRSPIAIIPNGVDIPSNKNPRLFLEHYPELKGKRIVLFLARLHPKKGLNLLLDAWTNIAASWPEAHLVIAGPDSEGTQARLEALVAHRGLAHQVLFTGMLRGKMKWSALAAAECFVLPSYSEGLSVGVLEAMGMGLPVIVTEGCNMPEVQWLRAGWVIHPELAQLASALGEFLRNDHIENIQIGCRGAAFINTRHNWTCIAQQMADVYRWLQGGPLPHTVELIFQ